MLNNGIIENSEKYLAHSYGRYPVAIESGNGSLLYDTDGKEYIDFGSGIAVNTFGIADKEWIEAVTAQLFKISHTSNYYYSSPQAHLAELMCKKTGLKSVFFSNSGAEANECAIKAARKYSFDNYGEGRSKIVTLKNSFHGRTVTTLSATGQDSFHTFFSPFTQGFSYAEANNIAETVSLIGDDCAAVLIELIQGEGGVNVLEKEYVKAIAELCGQKDILLIVDEVQTGNGRTGKLFCFEHYGILPDILTTAKGLGGGLPIGATLFGEKTKDVLTAGTHGSTFGGNPACAAGAFNILSRIDDSLLKSVEKKSNYIKSRLQNNKFVVEISGIGLMIGIKTTKDAKAVVNKCMEKGLLLLTAKDKVRLLPALNIPDEILEKGLSILEEALGKL